MPTCGYGSACASLLPSARQRPPAFPLHQEEDRVGSLFQYSVPGDGAGCRVESPRGTTLTARVLPGAHFSRAAIVPGASSSVEAQTICRPASVVASPENDSRMAEAGTAHTVRTRRADALGLSPFTASTTVPA